MVNDGFIPKNAVKQCNRCKKLDARTASCPTYPKRIPVEVACGEDCPDFEAKEQK